MTLECETCHLASPFEHFPDCLRCTAAVIAHNPHPWATNRAYYVGAPWLATLEREVARQGAALAASEAA